MKAGPMKTRIKIKRDLGNTRDALNAKIANFKVVKILWAEARPINGAEAIKNEKIISKEAITFFTWYQPDILITDRIGHAGNDYEISYIREVGLKEGLEIIAQRVA